MIKVNFLVIFLFFYLSNILASKHNSDTTYFCYTMKDSSMIELKYHYISTDTLVQIVNKITGKCNNILNWDTLIIHGFNVYRKCDLKVYKYLDYDDFIKNKSNLYKSIYNGTINFEKVIPLYLHSDKKNLVYCYTLDFTDAFVDLNCLMKYTFSIKDKRIIQIDEYY